MSELSAAWGESWLWLGGSLLVAALWTNLAWFFRQPRVGAVGDFVARLVAWRFSPWLLQLLRLLYTVGVPFAALLWMAMGPLASSPPTGSTGRATLGGLCHWASARGHCSRWAGGPIGGPCLRLGGWRRWPGSIALGGYFCVRLRTTKLIGLSTAMRH